MKNRSSAMRLAFVLPLFAWLFSAPALASQGSCIMPTVGTVSGLTLVNDINACNSALLSLYSGASAPSSPTDGMLWYNTTTKYVQQYNLVNTAWMNIWFVDTTNNLTTVDIGGGITSQTIASATTTDLGTVKQPFKTVSGTTTITSFGSSAKVGSVHVVVFSGALTLTYNATSLIIPGALSKTTANGDVAIAIYLGSSNWRVIDYVPITGAGVTSLDGTQGAFTTSAANGTETSGTTVQVSARWRTIPTTQVLTSGTNATYTTPANVRWLELRLIGGGSGGGGGQSATLSTAGGDTCWATSGTACTSPLFRAAGAAGSSLTVAGAPGTNTGGYSNLQGNYGSAPTPPGVSYNGIGGNGGPSCSGSGIGLGSQGSGTATIALANSGSGGGGGGATNGTLTGSGAFGGTSGGCVLAIIGSPAATYVYTIGAGGAGAAAGSSASSAGGAGNTGGSGRIEVIEHYGSFLTFALCGFRYRRRRPANDNKPAGEIAA